MLPPDEIPGYAPRYVSRTLEDAVHTAGEKAEVLAEFEGSDLFDVDTKALAKSLRKKSEVRGRLFQESLCFNNSISAITQGPAPR